MLAEFQRNIWLRFTAYRVLAMPIILGVVFFVTYVSNGRQIDPDMATVAAVLFAALAFPWGNRVTAESLSEEIVARTWDQQRMSAMSATSMVFGKLFGATLIVWIGMAFCAGVFAFSQWELVEQRELILSTLLLVLAGALGHGVTFLFTLLGVQRRGSLRAIRTGLYQVLGALTGLPLVYIAATGLGEIEETSFILLYERVFDPLLFVIMTAGLIYLLLLATAIAAMRQEFQQTNPFWLWPLGLLATMAYFHGVEVITAIDLHGLTLPPPGWFPAFLIALAATYIAVFSEAKSSLTLIDIRYRFRDGEWARGLSLIPNSLFALLALGGALVMLKVEGIDWTVGLLPGNAEPFLISLALLAVRDVALVHIFSLLSPNFGERRAFLILLVIYTVVPLLFSALEVYDFLGVFWPLWVEGYEQGVYQAGAAAAVSIALMLRLYAIASSNVRKLERKST